ALLVFTDRHGFLAWPQNGKSQSPTRKTPVAGRERLHESEHARFFQVREFSARKFSVAARANGDHLSTATFRHSASRRNLVLHFSFTFVHPRHLSGRVTTDEIPA